MRIEIEFGTDNADIADDMPWSAARLVQYVADSIRAGHGNGRLRDGNGNTVGTWEITDPD